ncbi:MAG: hypothetical protein AAF333_13385 [Planctomycetota bacterium]
MIYSPDLPTGYLPLGYRPDDARRYGVIRRVEGGDDELVATTEPGTLERVVEGINNSAERFYVTAVNRVDLPDRDVIDVDLRLVAFDGTGELILPVPSPVRNLRLVPGPGGQVSAEWYQRSRGAAPAAASFNVYVATGTDPIDFAAPALAGVSPRLRSRSVELGTFAHGTLVKAVVRAVSAQGAEEANTIEAQVTADAIPPAPASLLTVETKPS